MDRCAVFVDAGYLLAEGGALFCGTKSRQGIDCKYSDLCSALAQFASNQSGLPFLRVYWYDAAPQGIPTLDQLRIAALPNVKFRYGRLVGGEQKGVDSLIVRDLMTLGRERAIATAYLLGGDEDLREGVVSAQDMGVRIVVLGIPTTGRGNQAMTLIREADEHIVLETAFLSAYFSRAKAPVAAPAAQVGEAVGQAAQAISPRGQESQGEMARRLGAQFAITWSARATTSEVRGLIENAPRIPTVLDIQLMVEAETTLGSLRQRQDLKKDLRAGFWEAIKSVANPAA